MPIFIGGSLLTITVVLWQLVLAKEKADIALRTQLQATNLKVEITERISERILALVRMAKRWEFQENIAEAQLKADAILYIKHDKSYNAIAALDNKFNRRWIVTVVNYQNSNILPMAIKDGLKIATEAYQSRRDVTITHTIVIDQENKVFLAYLPIFKRNKFDGFIIAEFNTKNLLNNILLNNSRQGYEMVVKDNAEDYHIPSHIKLDSSLIKTEKIDLYGTVWHLQVWPKPEVLFHSATCFSNLVLVAGIIIAFLFTAIVYFAQTAIAQKEKVEAANLELKVEISQRQQVEQILRTSEERLRLALEAAKMGTWEWDLLTNELKYCEQLGPILGLPPGQYHPTYEAFINAVYPEDRYSIEQAVERAIKEKADYGLEYRVIWPDGTLHWISNKGQVDYDVTGTAVRFVGVAMDITAYKQTETALQESQHLIKRITDSIPSIVYIYDLVENRNVYTNREVGPSLGYTPEEIKKMGTSLHQNIIHPDDLVEHFEFIKKFNDAKDGEIREAEYRVKHANGEWRWIHTKNTVFTRTADGRVRQFLGCTQDITERKIAEAELQQVNEKLTVWIDELKLRNNEITILAKMSEFLQACLTVEEAYAAIAQNVQQLFPKVSGGIFAIVESRNLVEAVVTWGEHLTSQKIFTPNECWGLRRSRLHRFAEDENGILCQHQHSSLIESLCVPMMAQGEALGLLYLCSESSVFTEAKQQLAVTVAEHISLALANLKLREKLQTQSIRDPLTNLFNRRYMEESLEREIHRALRKQQPLGIIMLDVDHFKKFNDTFGHAAGDAVLQELGIFLQTKIRNSDIACRYGGEELMLILPETSLEDTSQRAEELREGIKHIHLQYHNQPLGILTLSLGVACFPEHGGTGDTVIRAADNALYQAKKAGRDRVVTAYSGNRDKEGNEDKTDKEEF